MLDVIHNASGCITKGVLVEMSEMSAKQLKPIFTMLLKERVLTVKGSMFKRYSNTCVIELYERHGIKHDLETRGTKAKLATTDINTTKPISKPMSISSLDDLAKLPYAEKLISFIAGLTTATKLQQLASVVDMDNREFKPILLKLVEFGILKEYHNSTYKIGNINAICVKLGIDKTEQQVAATNAVLWDEDAVWCGCQRFILAIKGASIYRATVHKAKALCSSFGVDEKTFVKSIAPVLIRLGVIASSGKGYIQGKNIDKVWEEVKPYEEEDGDTPKLNKPRVAKKLTVAQKRKNAEVVKRNIAEYEARRKKRLADAKERYENGFDTKSEYNEFCKEVNKETDDQIRNMRGE